MAGDSVNTQQIVVDAARFTETEKLALSLVRPRDPPLGKGTMENGAPLLLATASPRPRKENSFSGHICPRAAPPCLQIKTPETPMALVSGWREGAGRSSPQNQHRSTKQPFRPTPRFPALTLRPQNQAGENGVSRGRLFPWG